jgi:alpha-glucosidase
VRQVVAGYEERGLPLAALHLDMGGGESFPGLPRLATDLTESGVRLVLVLGPAVRAEPGNALYESGTAAGAFVRDARGDEVRGVLRSGESVYPDFTDPGARAWWGALYEERLAEGFSGVWHEVNEPAVFAPFGDATLPRSARHDLEGRGGDHREARNVYGLGMARSSFEGLQKARSRERPFLFSRSGWAGVQRYGGTG